MHEARITESAHDRGKTILRIKFPNPVKDDYTRV